MSAPDAGEQVAGAVAEPGHAALNLLLFSVGGVRFGCDAEQLTGFAAWEGEEGGDLFRFHEELGFGRPVAYRSPTALSVGTGGKGSYRVLIDQLEEIAEFSIQKLRPLPPLLEPLALRKGIWGVLPLEAQLVLLVDFQLLLKKKAEQGGGRHETEQGDPA